MAGYFNQLRKKPKHVRDNIAFGVAGSFTALIALGWFLIAAPKPEVVPGMADKESTPAFSTLFDQVKEQMAGVSESLPDQATSSNVTGADPATSETSSATASGTWRFPKEADIMVVPTASTTQAASSSPVLY